MTEIAGKVAVVTGGGSGIGRGLALALAAEGATLIVADIMKDNAQAVVQEIKETGGSALAVTCDVGDRASVKAMKDEANRTFGTVSLLFANAGVSSLQRFSDMSDDEVDWVIQINLFGVSNCLRVFLPDMVATRSGHVIATSSTAGMLPASISYLTAYSAAKAGVIGMMLNLRGELSKAGVGCTVFCPGQVTSQITQSPKYRPDRFGGPSDEMAMPPSDFVIPEHMNIRSAEEVAQMVLIAMRKNRPVVLTDSTMRQSFQEGYVDLFLSAFDDVVAFDKAHS
jgi:NAD(P)-dependent dehydrogenase (short-subunit alcohol dehydrogenase family)